MAQCGWYVCPSLTSPSFPRTDFAMCLCRSTAHAVGLRFVSRAEKHGWVVICVCVSVCVCVCATATHVLIHVAILALHLSPPCHVPLCPGRSTFCRRRLASSSRDSCGRASSSAFCRRPDVLHAPQVQCQARVPLTSNCPLPLTPHSTPQCPMQRPNASHI